MITERSVRTTIITAIAAAGMLHMQREAQLKLTMRKVNARNNPRGGTITALKSRIGDCFGVTKARALIGVLYLLSNVKVYSQNEKDCFQLLV